MVCNPEDFIVLYPGVYTDNEKDAVESYFTECEKINSRDPVDVKALISGTLPDDTPGIGPQVSVTEAMMRYNAEKYDPENPIYNDAEYAKALGFENLPAIFTYGAHDDTYTTPYPGHVRDTLLVSQLSHSVDNLAPIYPGDTLYMVHDKRTITDITPTEGSIYRTVALYGEGSIYNQKGIKVNHVIFNCTESVKIYKEGKRPAEMGFPQMWEAPDWTSRPEHYYSDADYEWMKTIWKGEKRQGNVPLYWEDVTVGDEPVPTLDGPIIESVLPTAPFGMGVGGTRTMKKEILDDEIFKTMIKRKKDGIYVLPNKADYTPAVPDGAKVVMLFDDGRDIDNGDVDTSDIHSVGEEDRAPIINFFGRDTALRHINNWMGDYGTVKNISWGIMCPETHAAFGKPVPQNPHFKNFLLLSPKTKDIVMTTHGLTKDIAYVKSVVADKYVLNGKFMVKLVWWIEEIGGEAWIQGSADVELPSRKAE